MESWTSTDMIKILKPNEFMDYPIPNKIVRIGSNFIHQSYYQTIIERQTDYCWRCSENHMGFHHYGNDGFFK